MAKIRDLAINTMAFTYGPDRNIGGGDPGPPKPCNPTPPPCNPTPPNKPPGGPGKPNKEFAGLPQEAVILLRRQLQHQIRRQLDS
jgi:hypothetical protein